MMSEAKIKIIDKGNAKISFSYEPDKNISGYLVIGVLESLIDKIKISMDKGATIVTKENDD